MMKVFIGVRTSQEAVRIFRAFDMLGISHTPKNKFPRIEQMDGTNYWYITFMLFQFSMYSLRLINDIEMSAEQTRGEGGQIVYFEDFYEYLL